MSRGRPRTVQANVEMNMETEANPVPQKAPPREAPTLKNITSDYVELRWDRNKKGGKSDWARTEPPTIVDFSYSRMEGQTLRDKNLQGTLFCNSILADNDFTGSDLRWASFLGCDREALKTCNFEGANLREAISARGKVIGVAVENPWD